MECTDVQLIIVSIVLLGISPSLYSVSYNYMYSLYVNFIIVIIVVAPETIFPPDDIIVINGSEAVLNCTVAGNPLPSISWSVVSGVDLPLLFSFGLEIPFDQQGRIYSNKVTNTILNNTIIHSSFRLNEAASFITGDYACGAFNYLGNVTRTAALTVHGKENDNFMLVTF